MHKLIKLAIAVAALSVCALAQQGGGGGGGTTLPSPTASAQCFVSTGTAQGNWTWGSCSGSSNLGFASITAGTNTAALVVGSGGTLTYTGTGVIDANEILNVALPAIASGYLNYNGSAWVFTNPFASPTFTGTVTISGLLTGCITNTAGVISSTGTPCNSPFVFPATASGTTTSGGVTYFSSTTVLSSSGLLAFGQFVLGGGAGGAPTTSFSVVPPVNGGSGVASPTANAVPVAEGSSNYNFVTTATSGLCFLSNGTGNDPSFQACPAGSTVFPLTISGTVTSGGIPYFSSTTVETSSAQLASGALVVGGGAGGAPATGNGDFTYATHTLTGGASGILNLSAMAATAFKIPTVAGAAPTADGAIATNSTTHALNVGSNGSTLVEAVAASGATSVSTNCGSTSTVVTAISGAAAPTCTSISSTYLPADVVYNDTTNTYTANLQSFAAATMSLPASAAYAPTTAGLFGYDSTNARLVFGNGSTTSIIPWFTGTSTNNDCAEYTGTLGALTSTTCVYKFSGDGTFASNSNSTGNVTLTLNTAGSHKWWGNNTGSTAAAGYEALTTSDLPTIQISGGGTNATSAAAGQVPNTSSSSASAWTASPNFGINGTTNGVLNLATSTGGGAYISILNGGATSAYNFNLPITVGSAGQVLASQGGGSSAMTWVSPLTNPMTTLGDMIYGGASGAVTRLAGPTGPNGIPQTICETPSAGAATAEAFCIPGVPVDTSNTATIPITDDVSLIAPTTLTALSGANMLTNNYAFAVLNDNTSAITYTPASGLVYPSGGSTQIIPPSWFTFVYTNNTNTYMPVMPTIAAFPNTSTNQALAFNSATGVLSAVTYGTVSSVGLTTNSGSSSGIFAVTGSPVTGSGTLNFNLSGTSGGIACFTSTTVLASSSALTANALTKGGGAGVCPTNSDLQESSNLLNNTTSTQSWTVAGGQDASANSVLGGITLRGANETGAGGSTSAGGGVLVAGGTNAATNAASQGGSIQVLPGLSTGGTQGLQGLDVQESVYVKGATVTQFNLECESASMTVVDCAATPGSWLGIAELVNSNTAQIVTDGQFTVNASAAVTLGDTVCAGSTAGKVTDSGGQSSCTSVQGSTVGIVMATSGTWVLPDGTSITATTTKPLIQMNTATVGGGGGSSVFPQTVSGTVTSGGIPYFSNSTTESTSAVLASGAIVVGGGAGGAPTTDSSATLSTGALSLGASGTAGSVAMGNATSGTVTLQPVTGALGTVTASLPANTGTIAELNLAQTWTAVQALGSSTATTQSQLDGSTKLATTLYTDTAVSNAVAGVNPAVAVLAASTANLTGTYTQVGGGVGDTFTITATGAFSLDGVALTTVGQRVLFKNQSTASQNGVYTVTVAGTTGISAVFTRALDYDTPSDVNNTGSIPVQSGTVNTTTSWLLTSQVTSIGSAGSSLTYAQFSYNPANVALLNAAQTWTALQTFGTNISIGGQSLSGGVQGTGDTKVLLAGTVSGTSAALCTDANGGATTSSCPSATGSVTGSGLSTGSVYYNIGGTLTPANAYGIPSALTVTFTNTSYSIAATNTLIAGAAVQFQTTGGLPTNFATATTYYVSTAGSNCVSVTTSAFSVSATYGGACIQAGSAGTGTQTMTIVPTLVTNPAYCVASSSTVCVYSGAITGLSGFTAGQVIYVSDATSGALTQVNPASVAGSSGHFVQRIGVATSTTAILVQPSMNVQTVQ